MAEIDHWHPVYSSRLLKDKPVPVRLAGRNLVLFRTTSGQVGALVDQCPHRRMRLSAGSVQGNKLRCRYHGWTYTCDGQGESPGTPKLHACAESYEAVDRFGAIWVKPRTAAATFPHFDVDGYYHLCTLFHRAQRLWKSPPITSARSSTRPPRMPSSATPSKACPTSASASKPPTPRSASSITAHRKDQSLPPLPPRHLAPLPVQRRLTTHSRRATRSTITVVGPQDGKESKGAGGYIFIPEDAGTTQVITFAFTKSTWPDRARHSAGEVVSREKPELRDRPDVDILRTSPTKPAARGHEAQLFDRARAEPRAHRTVYRGSRTPDHARSATLTRSNGTNGARNSRCETAAAISLLAVRVRSPNQLVILRLPT